MAENVTFRNNYMAYINNAPYIHPTHQHATQQNEGYIHTGWHILPTMLWRHFTTPAQWTKMVIDHEAYCVKGFKVSVYNMIPMTTQIAIQGTSVFTAFNNTIYALGYTDKFYETAWFPWFQSTNDSYNPDLAMREGLNQHGDGTTYRYVLPEYFWDKPHIRTTSDRTWGNTSETISSYGVYPLTASSNDAIYGLPTGLFWDPMNRPQDLMELRPGKNTMSYSFEVHPCDSEKWFNLDQIAWWWPYTSPGPYYKLDRPNTYHLSSQCDPDRLQTQDQVTPPVNDYTMPNLANLPIIPTGWWWKEMQQSLIESFTDPELRPDLKFPGTEYELAKYPPTQHFLKMIPLFDANGTLVNITANISISVELHLLCKKRRTAIYCPTWGPLNWKGVYSSQKRFLCFQPSFIRYRTGGARWTWQNILGSGNTSGSLDQNHPRETPYTTRKNATGTGTGGTYTITTTQSTAKPNLVVTFSKDADRAVIEQAPAPRKRGIFKTKSPERSKSPEKMDTTRM
ncbi:capsid protein [Peafowl parvovirus 1]|uniref:Capsid protein n=1 Tax=Peafowl parvovirus 1 TaxID=2668086 RepID=A0A649UXV8_9VIRU|nr:capsid protein [Peafowl parvovirus 1]QGJ83203.1 capsid protein [Peafowl parvovirus 1]